MNLIALNKPFGTICQFSAHETRPSLGDWVKTPGVYAAGRLDADSEGLLLLTDDGRSGAHRGAAPQARQALLGAGRGRAGPRRPEGARARRRPRRLRDASVPRRIHRTARHAVAAQSADPLPRRDPDDVDRACDHGGQEPSGAPDDGGRRLPDAAPGACRHRRTGYIRARHCTGRNDRTAATRTVGGFRGRRMTNSGRANFSSSFSSTGCEDRALNHADANLSYPALAAEPVFASRKRRFYRIRFGARSAMRNFSKRLSTERWMAPLDDMTPIAGSFG